MIQKEMGRRVYDAEEKHGVPYKHHFCLFHLTGFGAGIFFARREKFPPGCVRKGEEKSNEKFDCQGACP